MNYSIIKNCDIANGPGIRTSLFVSGCRHHCPGCFNSGTWSFAAGNRFTGVEMNKILSELHHSYVEGFSLLGGEPFEPENQEALASVLCQIKSAYPDKTIWCWTGYTLDEDLIPGGKQYTEYTDRMLQYIDVIVDGAFIESLKDLNLAFRGSSNQRIIDVKETIKQKNIILINL